MIGYAGVIHALTINDNERLKQQITQVTVEMDQIRKIEEAHREEMRIMQESIEKRFRDIVSKINTGKLG